MTLRSNDHGCVSFIQTFTGGWRFHYGHMIPHASSREKKWWKRPIESMWRLIFYWGTAGPDMSAVNVSNKHIHFIYCIFIGQRSSTPHFLIVVKKKLRWEEEVSNTIKSRLFSRRVIWLMLTWLLYSIDNCQALSQSVLLPKLRTQFERITNHRYWKGRWKKF